ncbi:3-demethylubiquinone-9 3-methyltransferase [Tumidithrix helvetica PCC 7403]|uniref:class I SAM-dependent methyltransferase n=1 Tax=Tumidithrix helvetica TaxID=3457545 RepID=UPI003CB104FA
MKVNTTYEPFSQQPEYIETNRGFIRSLPLDSVTKVLDLACGTGTLTELLFEVRPDFSVIGIDISSVSLEIGRKLFREQNRLVSTLEQLQSAQAAGKGGVLMLEGSADEVPLASESMDLVIMGNAIHLLPDKDKLVSEAYRVLRPGGHFAFNSSFYIGTYPEGTEYVYTEWVKEAVGFITEKDEEDKRAGGTGIKRQRGTRQTAFNKGWMSPQQWQEVLERNNFIPEKQEIRTMMMNQESFETVGAYAGFSEVMMSGYPLEIGSEALQEGAKRAFQKLNIVTVPRFYLEMTGRKP